MPWQINSGACWNWRKTLSILWLWIKQLEVTVTNRRITGRKLIQIWLSFFECPEALLYKRFGICSKTSFRMFKMYLFGGHQMHVYKGLEAFPKLWNARTQKTNTHTCVRWPWPPYNAHIHAFCVHAIAQEVGTTSLYVNIIGILTYK